jgi:hypothetical protein
LKVGVEFIDVSFRISPARIAKLIFEFVVGEEEREKMRRNTRTKRARFGWKGRESTFRARVEERDNVGAERISKFLKKGPRRRERKTIRSEKK